MTWLIRAVDDGGGGFEREIPDYGGDTDLFTIKLHFGGSFEPNPKRYVGGVCEYVDNCDADEMSLLEVYSMLTDIGVDASLADVYYKVPEAGMEDGIFPITSDSQVVEMCTHLDSTRMLYVYCVIGQETLTQIPPPSQFPPPSQPFDPIDDPVVRSFERKQLRDILELEGIPLEMYDIDDLIDSTCGVDIPIDVSDHEKGSFHDDSSNIDSTDEDVRSVKKKKDGIMDVPVHCHNWIPNEEESDFSDELQSDEERMVANSTDDEDREMRFKCFIDETDLADPKFEIGMTFTSANSFRKAVRTQAIIERRAIRQVRNFGRRVKFVCEISGCRWKIYGSRMQRSSTFQIKSITRKHTCPQTFEQKHMSSRWIAEYYENDLRINPTWPLSAFRLKVVNDWKCDVSRHIIGRARRLALKNIKGDHVAHCTYCKQKGHNARTCAAKGGHRCNQESGPDTRHGNAGGPDNQPASRELGVC